MEKKQVLFIHGGGEGGYDADAKQAASLQEALGATYKVRYPEMHDEDTPDFGWGQQIGEEISAINGEIILVGHSLGASMLLKWKGLMLRKDFANTLPGHIPIFLYHSRDDEEVARVLQSFKKE